MQRYFNILGYFFFVYLLCSGYLIAQDTTISTLDSSKVYFFHNDFEFGGPEFLKGIDTLITGIQKYDQITKPGNYYSSLGNNGHANISMVYKPTFKSGVDFGNTSALEKYMFNNDSLNYYWVGKPFTQLNYVMGSKKEQNLFVDHSQNVSSWFNVGLTLRYTNSPGYYPNQETDDKNFAFKTRFQTKNYRYVVLANYLHNKIRLEENGGIKYDSIFEQNIESNRQNFTVNLTTAKNTLKENTYYVKQFFFISKRHRFRLSTNDSLTPQRKIIPGNISLSTLYSRNIQVYQQDSSDNSFYRNYYDSVNPTYDSTFVSKVENQLSWTNSDNAKRQLLTFNFALKHLYSELTVDTTKTFFNQLIPSAEVKFTVSDILKLYFSGDIVTGNAYAGDFHLKGALLLHTKFGDLSYSLTSALQEPDRFYGYYSSNHFRWSNNLNKQGFFLNTIEYKIKNLHAGVNFFNIGNFVYFDSLAMPAQLGSNLNVFSAFLRKLINVGNWSFDLRGVYQTTSDDALRVPELAADISIYFTKDLFKKATILQTGVDVFYNTSYFSYAYMPAIKSFYVQNSVKTGDYFYTNVFLNLQIKRSRIFVKYINLAYLLKDFSYYTVPSYPMQDGGFRFGVSWMFYD